MRIRPMFLESNEGRIANMPYYFLSLYDQLQSRARNRPFSQLLLIVILLTNRSIGTRRPLCLYEALCSRPSRLSPTRGPSPLLQRRQAQVDMFHWKLKKTTQILVVRNISKPRWRRYVKLSLSLAPEDWSYIGPPLI